MPFSMTTDAGQQTLRLEGAVTVRDASKLGAVLAASLDDSRPLAVDTSGLLDIDTCVLQLLCSLQKTVPELIFAAPSAALLNAMERAQLRRSLLGGGDTL
jgi:ABC-type transporter Mla MlaB component